MEIENLTVDELARYTGPSTTLEVKDGYDGKILCRNYDEKKHAEIGKRKVLYFWAEIKTRDIGFGNVGLPVICVYAEHKRGD